MFFIWGKFNKVFIILVRESMFVNLLIFYVFILEIEFIFFNKVSCLDNLFE